MCTFYYKDHDNFCLRTCCGMNYSRGSTDGILPEKVVVEVTYTFIIAKSKSTSYMVPLFEESADTQKHMLL